MIIKAIRAADEQDGSENICTGELRYRANWIGQLIVQVRKERFVAGEGWINEWIDAKPYHVTLSEDC